jgi:hypothetical protein
LCIAMRPVSLRGLVAHEGGFVSRKNGFPLKIALKKVVNELFITSQLFCDERRHPRRGAPAAGQ